MESKNKLIGRPNLFGDKMELMLMEFSKNPSPSETDIKKYAKLCRVSAIRVKTWFKNQREKRQRSYSHRLVEAKRLKRLRLNVSVSCSDSRQEDNPVKENESTVASRFAQEQALPAGLELVDVGPGTGYEEQLNFENEVKKRDGEATITSSQQDTGVIDSTFDQADNSVRVDACFVARVKSNQAKDAKRSKDFGDQVSDDEADKICREFFFEAEMLKKKLLSQDVSECSMQRQDQVFDDEADAIIREFFFEAEKLKKKLLSQDMAERRMERQDQVLAVLIEQNATVLVAQERVTQAGGESNQDGVDKELDGKQNSDQNAIDDQDCNASKKKRSEEKLVKAGSILVNKNDEITAVAERHYQIYFDDAVGEESNASAAERLLIPLSQTSEIAVFEVVVVHGEEEEPRGLNETGSSQQRQGQKDESKEDSFDLCLSTSGGNLHDTFGFTENDLRTHRRSIINSTQGAACQNWTYTDQSVRLSSTHHDTYQEKEDTVILEDIDLCENNIQSLKEKNSYLTAQLAKIRSEMVKH